MRKQSRTASSGAQVDPAEAHASSAVSFRVLHVDDDPNDTALLQAATLKAQVPVTLINLEDGERAMAYLSGSGPYADRQKHPAPNLILLDLKMPRTTGFEILEWIRGHAHLNQIPVVVLSGSELQDDIQRAYAGGASSYLVKPLSFEALVTLVKDLHGAWFAEQQALLPANHATSGGLSELNG